MARKPPSEAAYPSHFSVFLAALGARKPRCPGVRHRPTLRAAGSRERLRRSAEARARGCAAPHEPLHPSPSRTRRRATGGARRQRRDRSNVGAPAAAATKSPPLTRAAGSQRRNKLQVAEGLARAPVVRQVSGVARAPRTSVRQTAPPPERAAFAPRRVAHKGTERAPRLLAATKSPLLTRTAEPKGARGSLVARSRIRRCAPSRAQGTRSDATDACSNKEPAARQSSRLVKTQPAKDADRRRASEGASGARDSPAFDPSGLRAAQRSKQGARSGATAPRSANRQAGRRRDSERPCGAPDRPAFAPSGLLCREECKTRGEMGCQQGLAANKKARRSSEQRARSDAANCRSPKG